MVNTAGSPQFVSELIDMSTVSWDILKLQQFFTPTDMETIVAIPLRTRRQADFWAWHHEKNGVFSVRSAYRMLAEMKVGGSNAGRSNTKEEEKEWTTLWGVKVPSKVRIFLWRLARSSLPSKDVLGHRKMADNNVSSIIYMRDGRFLVTHSLLECNMAHSVWALEREDITEHLRVRLQSWM